MVFGQTDVICFQEIKLSDISSAVLRSLVISHDTSSAFVVAKESIGGLLIGHKNGHGSRRSRGISLCV